MKQTAVEWLKQDILTTVKHQKEITEEQFEKRIEGAFTCALELEKDQIKDAYLRGIKNYDPTFKSE